MSLIEDCYAVEVKKIVFEVVKNETVHYKLKLIWDDPKWMSCELRREPMEACPLEELQEVKSAVMSQLPNITQEKLNDDKALQAYKETQENTK